MPKKTRQQKIKADQRKTEQSLIATYSFTASAPTSKTSPQTDHSGSITHMITDIRKTVILGVVFILAEMGLYFFSPTLGW